MFIDAHSLPAGTQITTQLCIVGAGPAGITLAKELIKHQLQVCVIESGGLDLDEQTQKLYDAHTTNKQFKLTGTRIRQFGGTSNSWNIQLKQDVSGVRHGVLDEIDFQEREWILHSGWPFSKSHLNPYYERAQVMCKAGPYAYEGSYWETERAPAFKLNDQKLTTNVFQFGPKSAFYEDIKNEFEHSPFLQIYLHANVTSLETTPNGEAVTAVKVATLTGKEFALCAEVFILATGGIESARLLLASDSICHTGIGNTYDQVGRFFMDHPLIYGGRLVPYDPHVFQSADLYDLRCVDDTYIMGKIGLAEEAQKKHQLLNISAILFPRVNESKVLSAINIRQARINQQSALELTKLMKEYGPWAIYSHLYWLELPDFALHKGGWSTLNPIERLRFSSFDILHQTEQIPDPANRVTLSADKDALGMRKIQLHWHWNDQDKASIRKAQQIMKDEFARSGIGDFQISAKGEAPHVIYSGTHHHLGTTRMHCNPQKGVVNADCRVHGVDNLYIASSSVFPTGGFVNPTLTIVALSIRMADHVADQLKARKPLHAEAPSRYPWKG